MDVVAARPWHPARQCTATSKSTGLRCQRSPIAGGAVCGLHGGSIPAVQAAAKARLIGMVEPVLNVFEEILSAWHRTRCDACGHPTGDAAPVIQVGRLVLDRAGFHPTLTIEQAAPVNPYADYTEDALITKLESLLVEAKTRRDQHRDHRAEHLLPLLTEDVYVDDSEPDIQLPIQEGDGVIPERTLAADDCIGMSEKDFCSPAQELLGNLGVALVTPDGLKSDSEEPLAEKMFTNVDVLPVDRLSATVTDKRRPEKRNGSDTLSRSKEDPHGED